MYRKMRCKIPMNIQKFADPGTGDNGAGGTGNAGGLGATPPTPPTGQAPQFDYEKLASLIAGKQSVTEESVLKGYFKQQGLSKEQMDQAIAAFKQQQAANQPNIADMQSQITHGQEQVAAAQKAAGADTPSPIKDRKDSVKIALGIFMVRVTMMAPIAFGIRWRTRIFPVRAPTVLAAIMYS